MRTSLFDEIGLAKDFFRKPGERQLSGLAQLNPVTIHSGYFQLPNHVYYVGSYGDRMTHSKQHFPVAD